MFLIYFFMDIVVSVDKQFVLPTGVMAYSVCCNNQGGGGIFFHFIIDEGISEKDKENLN